MAGSRVVAPEDWADPHPIFAVWEVTLRCDQACAHCGSRAGLARRVELDTEGALAVVDQLAEVGVREVALLGGEAYLRDDWLTIVRAVRERGMRCSLVTAGRRLDAERARGLAEAGLDYLAVSVDGLADAHDELRGIRGSWEAAMAAIAAAREAGIPVGVNTQINARTRWQLPTLADALVARGVAGWQLQLTVPMGRAADQERLVVQPYELPELMDELAALAPGLRARGLNLMIANNLGYYGPHEAVLRPGSPWMGCQAGRFSIGIQSDGRYKPCASLPAEYAEEPLTRVSLQRILDHGRRPLVERTVDDLRGFCRTCYYAETCLAGCPWMAHTFLGRPGDNPFCVHRALELRARGRRERLVRVADAPGERFDHGLWEIVEEPLA